MGIHLRSSPMFFISFASSNYLCNTFKFFLFKIFVKQEEFSLLSQFAGQEIDFEKSDLLDVTCLVKGRAITKD